MPMASHRRIHNFGQQHRVPSIEVYSSASPPKDSEGEYLYYGGRSGGTTTSNGRTSGTVRSIAAAHQNAKQTALLITSECSPSRDFRILSSSLNPLGHISATGNSDTGSSNSRNQQRDKDIRRHSHGRVSNSRSTGNLNLPADHGGSSTRLNGTGTADGKDVYQQLGLNQKPVYHASSQGVLSSSRLTATRRQDSSTQSTPSPTRRNFASRTATLTMQRQGRADRLRSPYASFDDYHSPQGEDDEEDEDQRSQQRDSPRSGRLEANGMTFPGEPLTVLGNIIRPSTHETTARKLEIRYSARNDKYKRPTNPIRMKANGWNMLVYAERNMEWLTEHCRIGEQEEVMTYLSRKPGTSSAYIEWRFDFTEAGLRVKKCSLKFPFETFEDGHVRVYLKADSDDNVIPVYSSLIATDVPKMRGWDRFSLIAELDCERSGCAFQHAQLFRQQLKSGFFDKQEEKYQFLMSLELYSMY